MTPTLVASRTALPLQGATPPEAAHLKAVQARAGGLGAVAFSPEGAAPPAARLSRFRGGNLHEQSWGLFAALACLNRNATLVASYPALPSEGAASPAAWLSQLRGGNLPLRAIRPIFSQTSKDASRASTLWCPTLPVLSVPAA